MLEKWIRLDQIWDMEDAYFQTTNRIGPRYTRQVKRGDRLDQARLDRVYTNKGGRWITRIPRVLHDGTEAISDHIPVLVELTLAGRRRSKKVKRTSYLKLDVESFRNPRRKVRIQEEWESGWSLSPDPILAWDMTWGKVRDLFKRFREEDRATLSVLKQKQQALDIMRQRIEHDRSEELWAEYALLEKAVHDGELLEASIVRRRSRVRWIQNGDACTRYFFQSLKEKQRQEKITGLQDEEGQLQEDEMRMGEIIHSFYGNLYNQPTITRAERAERAQVLALVNRYVENRENARLMETPGQEEVEKIIRGMAKHKSPGEDGIPIEILEESWGWLGDKCMLVIQTIWAEKRLRKINTGAIIKLLPKNNERLALSNWRPISLLCIIYKLIAKVLATRLKDIIPKLVDEEQTGFVSGRNIMDNIVCVKLSQDFAEREKLPAIFCKLDFVKVFDMVGHDFLWDLLAKMRFSQDFISLVRALISEGTAKVHYNGIFTQSFKLGRGVRQECPVFPLLFALFTQPLMRILNEEERTGRITGCRILMTGEETTYLGCRIGRGLGEEEHTRDLAAKLQRKLAAWENRSLAWTSRVVLLKHVLRSVPVYQFLGIGLNTTGYKRLETPCRVFLWGTNTEGKSKTALVAWEQITKQRKNGGLGITTFRDTGDILKMRYSTRVLDGEEFDWANLFKHFTAQGMTRKTYDNETKWWSPEEGLLLLPTIPCNKSSVAKHFLKSWLRFRNMLTLAEDSRELPGTLTIWQLQLLMQRYGGRYSYNARMIHPILKKIGIQVLMHLRSHDGWINIRRRLAEYRMGTNRTKLWTWKILRRGFFTGERAMRMTVSNGQCVRCNRAVEMITHLFWDCPETQYVWNEIGRRFNNTDTTICLKPSLLENIDAALSTKNEGRVLIHILVAACQNIWADRNHKVFKNQRRQTPVTITFQNAIWEKEATLNQRSSAENWEEGMRGLDELNRLLEARAPERTEDAETELELRLGSLSIITGAEG
ncbi:hypothetical protein R1sor_013856 [Riccia sorocarpa]|uniref:Reverse transcriptase domain-containing protein n=1 Tax=Riccia sorocarpa TaxID=122646 RepID=A0ABD3HAD9_9MARC